MQLYQSRALVRTCLFGSIINPIMMLIGQERGIWQQLALSLLLFVIPLLIGFCYRLTGKMQVCGILYITYSSAVLIWAQLAGNTIHAIYWTWFTFLIAFCTLLLGVKKGGILTVLAIAVTSIIFRDNLQQGHSLGNFSSSDSLLGSEVMQVVLIQICFTTLMVAYDTIRNRTEVHAIMLQFTSEETDRLASIGDRMGGMALQLNEQLSQFQGQLLRLDVLAKRSDTKVEEFQKMTRDLQLKAQALSDISNVLTLAELEPEVEPRSSHDIRSA